MWDVLIKVKFCKLILLNCGNVWNSLDIFQYQILPKELGECRKVQWSRFEIKIVLESKFCRNQTENLVPEFNKVHWNLISYISYIYIGIEIWQGPSVHLEVWLFWTWGECVNFWIVYSPMDSASACEKCISLWIVRKPWTFRWQRGGGVKEKIIAFFRS